MKKYSRPTLYNIKYGFIDYECYSCHNRSLLKESLDTEVRISNILFQKLVQRHFYYFYDFDNRINAFRYIFTDIEHIGNFPLWINVYIGKRDLSIRNNI